MSDEITDEELEEILEKTNEICIRLYGRSFSDMLNGDETDQQAAQPVTAPDRNSADTLQQAEQSGRCFGG
jgi:hypothetical protein